MAFMPAPTLWLHDATDSFVVYAATLMAAVATLVRP